MAAKRSGLLVALFTLLHASAGWAAGATGAFTAPTTLEAGTAMGWDNVGGHGTHGVPFVEVGGRVDRRVLFPRLSLGVAFSARLDLASPDFDSDDWQGPSPALAAQLTVAYDSPTLFLSAGPRLYGDAREGRAFRMGIMPFGIPFGVLRARFGHTGGSFVTADYADAMPYTAAGGGSLQLQQHFGHRAMRAALGLYTTPFEGTAGVTFAHGLSSSSPLSLGFAVGTDLRALGRRAEVIAHLVWHAEPPSSAAHDTAYFSSPARTAAPERHTLSLSLAAPLLGQFALDYERLHTPRRGHFAEISWFEGYGLSPALRGVSAALGPRFYLRDPRAQSAFFIAPHGVASVVGGRHKNSRPVTALGAGIGLGHAWHWHDVPVFLALVAQMQKGGHSLHTGTLHDGWVATLLPRINVGWSSQDSSAH